MLVKGLFIVYPAQAMYTIGEAAERAGLSVEVLRAWERRYGVISPRRTTAGYRLYDSTTIERLRAMRRLVEDGSTPSAAAAALQDVSDADLAAVAPESAAVDASEDPANDLARRFVGAAAAMDASAVEAVLDEMGARASFELMVDRYLFPALHALGDAWQSGQVSVAAEHAASAAVLRWLGRFYDAASSSHSDARPVLIGLAEGARHELGALVHATAARRAGLPVVYLGADVPTVDWLRAARTTNARVAVIGIPTPSDRAAARTVAAALRRAVPGLRVVFGGGGATDTGRRAVLSPSVVAAIRELLALVEEPTAPSTSRGTAR